MCGAVSILDRMKVEGSLVQCIIMECRFQLWKSLGITLYATVFEVRREEGIVLLRK